MLVLPCWRILGLSSTMTGFWKFLNPTGQVWTVRPSDPFTLKLPHVVRERCMGCGICEYKCPRAGEAAIRVYRADK